MTWNRIHSSTVRSPIRGCFTNRLARRSGKSVRSTWSHASIPARKWASAAARVTPGAGVARSGPLRPAPTQPNPKMDSLAPLSLRAQVETERQVLDHLRGCPFAGGPVLPLAVRTAPQRAKHEVQEVAEWLRHRVRGCRLLVSIRPNMGGICE